MGAPLPLCLPDHPLLLEQCCAVPRLDPHPDPARHQVACRRSASPARHPRPPTRACPAPSVSSALMLLVPSLNPNRFRGVACSRRGRRGAAEAQLRILHRDGAEADPGQVAHRVHRDLRVVGARLDADVAAAAGGVEDLVGELRQVGQRGGALVGDAEPVLAVLSKNDGPNPIVRVSWERRQPERLAGILRRRIGIAADRTVRHGSSPRVIRSAISVHCLQQVDDVGRGCRS